MAAAIRPMREVVCRMLYRFEDEGLVELRRKEFMIADHKKLVALADM